MSCCDNIVRHQITCLFPGVIRYNCGECGRYIHHVVDGEMKHLTKDPEPPKAAEAKRTSKKKAAPPKKTAQEKAAEKIRQEQAMLVKRLAEIRRVLGEAAADPDSLEL